MKERDDSSFSGEFSLKDIPITNNDVEKFRIILGSKDFVSIHINALNPIYINIKIYNKQYKHVQTQKVAIVHKPGLQYILVIYLQHAIKYFS